MSVFILPAWVTRKIDQIRRRFLWHGSKDRDRQARALYMVNWPLATMPRKKGGLGVRDIKVANQTLMLKWMWQWKSQPHAWWKKAIVLTDTSDTPWNDPRATAFWKKMKCLQPVFDCCVSHHIGNGANTKFWHDAWNGTPLKFQFPHLYSHAPNKHYSVCQYMNEQGWLLNIPNLTQLAQMEKNHLMSLLQQIHITQPDSQDSVTWIRSSNTFSASTAYKFLTDCPSPTSPLRTIWAIRVPLRVLMFTWLKLSNRLTTVDNLTRRGWNLPNMCIMCKADAESTQHLFHTCQLAIQIGTYIHNTFLSQVNLQHKFVMPSSAELLTDLGVHSDIRKWEIATSFVLWRERCSRIFTEEFQQPMSLIRQIKLEISNWSNI